MTNLALPTPAGVFTAGFSERGLARLRFPEETCPASAEDRLPEPIRSWASLTSEAVNCILAGVTPGELPPFDLHSGTEFQRRVWSAMCRIPLGETKSYGEIAREIGAPDGTRAVGSACGANPIPLLIPCHRVVASGGRLGGFSGGLPWKKRLLAIEGVLGREGELPFR